LLFAGLAVGALLGYPLLSPAPSSQGETPELVEPPKVWDGVVREFLVIGPLPRTSRLIWRLERNPDPAGNYEEGDLRLRWEPQRVDERGALKFPSGEVLKPAVLFAQVQIYSPSACRAKLFSGSADLK